MSTSEKPYHHGDLRSALLDAADALLDQGGDGAVSLREAARMAGVSATAAYRHFADKEALLAALAARHFAEFGAALAGKPLPEMGPAYVRFALARPGRFRLMFGPLLRRAGGRPPLSEAAGAAFAALNAAAPSPEAALRAWALVHGLAHLLLDGAIPAEDPEAVVARLLT
ncbi:TetR-like C-terminal domain-containing protein [Rubritepida flocculans]|uniref:TetR-like C-terminal domain-containing protein n=1 Tax=Rubritepida flocculans TaxID=182403 RepID=UPI000406D01C|nr:TetR-like C-terminal domain-containing protein [Rubritepida flocculans]